MILELASHRSDSISGAAVAEDCTCMIQVQSLAMVVPEKLLESSKSAVALSSSIIKLIVFQYLFCLSFILVPQCCAFLAPALNSE